MDGDVKAGQKMVVTAGEYSDYQIAMIAEAVCDFNIYELRAEYLALHPEQAEEYSFERDQFLAWLVNTKQVARELVLDWMEWHVESYGNVSKKDMSGQEVYYTIEPWRDCVTRESDE